MRVVPQRYGQPALQTFPQQRSRKKLPSFYIRYLIPMSSPAVHGKLPKKKTLVQESFLVKDRRMRDAFSQQLLAMPIRFSARSERRP
mmetsp:Transcript_118194/g.185669  ORF Transcript_118194/g.185669 Transcript_118194/m.185669 type:complete len:87 (-) Transcript_118194:605-865(-)